MVDTLLERSEDSHREFIRDCVSLVIGGLRGRGYRSNRLALVGIALVACASGSVVALTTTGGSPVQSATGVGARVPMTWPRANQQATALVFRHGGSCQIRGGSQAGSTQLLHGRPTTDLSSMLAVLRRPAPAGQRVSATQLRGLHVDVQGIYVRYARQGVTDGITYYMIPATSVGGMPMPANCYSKQLTAFEHHVAALPAPQRTRAIIWERKLIRENKGPRDGVVLVTAGGGSIGAEYLTVARLRADPWSGAGGGGSNHITKTALLVPDSVASVTARYAAQTYPGRVPRPIEVTRRVSDNVAIFVFRGAWDPPSLTYRSTAGTVLSSTIHG
jgi:hypothetical protein